LKQKACLTAPSELLEVGLGIEAMGYRPQNFSWNFTPTAFGFKIYGGCDILCYLK